MSLNKTNIGWCTHTFNPAVGCEPASLGCQRCYARSYAERYRGIQGHHFEKGFDFVLKEDRLESPLRRRKPSRIFVGSMTDIFFEKISDDYILRIFDTMVSATQHQFQILTKRIERLVDWVERHLDVVPDNVWIGATIESQDYVHRIEHLAKIPAKIRFISFEPLLSRIVIPDELMAKIQFAIVGGETGHGARRMEESWAIELRDQCNRLGIPFWFKQMGEYNSQGQRVGAKRAGKKLAGQVWNELPDY